MFDGIEMRKSSLANECDDAESLLKNFLWHYPGLFLYPGSDMLTYIRPYHWDLFGVGCMWFFQLFENLKYLLRNVSKTKWPCASEKSCERWMHPFVHWVFSSHRSVDGQIFPWKVKVQVAFVVWSTLRLERIARGVVLAASTAFTYSANPSKKLEPSQTGCYLSCEISKVKTQ